MMILLDTLFLDFAYLQSAELLDSFGKPAQPCIVSVLRHGFCLSHGGVWLPKSLRKRILQVINDSNPFNMVAGCFNQECEM